MNCEFNCQLSKLAIFSKLSLTHSQLSGKRSPLQAAFANHLSTGVANTSVSTVYKQKRSCKTGWSLLVCFFGWTEEAKNLSGSCDQAGWGGDVSCTRCTLMYFVSSVLPLFVVRIWVSTTAFGVLGVPQNVAMRCMPCS